MGRRKPAYTTEAMNRKRHEAEMESIRKHDLSIEDRGGEAEGTDARSASAVPEGTMLVLRHSLPQEPRNV